MDIIYNYEGASIELIKNDEQNNKIYLSLRKEKDNYSHYYNFKIDNNNETFGEIHIKNINLSQYYNKNIVNAPYIKIEKWRRLEKEEFYIDNNELIIKVDKKTKAELSLVPRYVESDLSNFLSKIVNQELKIYRSTTDEIILGNEKLPAVIIISRQHPGETLSSFFVEGIIEEILNSNNLLEKYCFVIYPMVNRKGIEKGVHRYINGIDYNRNWNSKDAPEEIKYIKEQLKKYNIKYFVDVHNDEITDENYIRTSGKLKEDNIAGIRKLGNSTKFRRFIRALIKQKRFINIFSESARDYVFKKYKCISFLVELSMLKDYEDIRKLGSKFIRSLLGE